MHRPYSFSRLAASLLLIAISGVFAVLPVHARPNDQSMPTERVVKANGLAFRTIAWGPEDGPPVLLLHGFPQEALTWGRIASGLAKAGYRVVAFDQRGYSENARPDDLSKYNFEELVGDAIAVADAYGFKRFNVAGMGLGSAQSWILSARNPDRVISLVALRYPHPAAMVNAIRTDPEQAEMWAKFANGLGGGSLADKAALFLANDGARLRAFLSRGGLSEPWLSSTVKRLQQPGALVGAMAWEHAMSLDELAKVPAVTVPTLFIWAKAPPLAESAIQAASSYVKAPYQLEELDGTGNFVIENASDRILTSMLRFYGEINTKP